MTEGKALAQSPGALASVRVVDLTRVVGGQYCTMLLSDLSADVPMLEPHQGDKVCN